jgi:hypothetical protein
LLAHRLRRCGNAASALPYWVLGRLLAPNVHARAIVGITRAVAPLGALVAGGCGGALLGICAGPIGLCVGTSIGSAVGLLAFAVLAPRRRKVRAKGTPAHTALATRRVLRFVGWLAVSVFGLLAVAAALLAGLSAVDDGASDEASLLLLAGAISAGLLAVGAAILRALRRAAIVERPRAPDDLWQR